MSLTGSLTRYVEYGDSARTRKGPGVIDPRNVEPTPAQRLGARLRKALLAASHISGERITLADFGARVAGAEGRAESYPASTVSAWMQGQNEPKLATISAIARVVRAVGVTDYDEAWLAFGSPEDRERDAKLAEERRQRARQTVREIVERVEAKKRDGKSGKHHKPRTARGG